MNIYLPVQNIRSTEPKVGGLCWMLFFKWEDVLQWPSYNPQTGLLDSALQLKVGKSFYAIQPSEKDRYFKETEKKDDAGPYHEISVSMVYAGNTNNVTLSLQTMQFHRFGIILKDRNGEQRLVGNADSGASLSFDYTSADYQSTRKRAISFLWENPLPAPIYNGQSIIVDDQIIPVVNNGGDTTNLVTSLQLVTRFRVGDPGAPMADGNTVYTNNDIINKNVMVFSSGSYLNQVTSPIERHIIKTYGQNYISFVGGVTHGETIEIYAY